MDILITTFHLDWHSIVAQMVNFGVVVVVLWWAVFKPLSKVMSERTHTIEASLAQARDIEERVKQTAHEQTALITAARHQAQDIIMAAEQRAAEQRQQALVTAKAEVEKIVAQGRTALAQEKVAMVRQAQGELADIIIAATDKMIGSMTDKKLNHEMVEQALKDVKRRA